MMQNIIQESDERVQPFHNPDLLHRATVKLKHECGRRLARVETAALISVAVTVQSVITIVVAEHNARLHLYFA